MSSPTRGGPARDREDDPQPGGGGVGDTRAGPSVLDQPSGGPSDLQAATSLTAVTGGASVQASLLSDAWRQLRRNPVFLVAMTVLAVLVVMAVRPQLFTSVDPRSCDLLLSKRSPSAQAWFGYDVQGCDYFSNVVHGARVSIAIGVLVSGASLVLGVVLGSLAGYYGGWVDAVIARVADVFFGIPYTLGTIVVLNAFPERGLLIVALALITFGWMTMLRLLRSNVIAVKQTDYVQAARALGAGDRRILVRHILPNALAPVFVYATIGIGTVIAAEATLSFLGIGLQLPAISWGLQISEAQSLLRTAPHLLLFPSLFLSVTVLCFILLGDALRDALDPKLR